MSTASLEERVETLETQYAELLDVMRARPAKNGWRTVVRMFRDDPQIEELHRETQRIREEDRAATCNGSVGEV